MFHRLTLFDMNNELNVVAVNQAFQALQVKTYNNLHSANANFAVHQWQWNSSPECVLDLEVILQKLSKQQKLDYVLQSSQQPIQKIKLAVFDMDSTLIQAEVMDELAYAMGIGPQVALITASSMAGELDFEQSFRQRLALLKGFDTAQLSAINQALELMPGAEQLMKGLQKQGVYCAILSGGFSYFADDLAHRLGMQQAFSNSLEEVDGKLTGQVTGVILDAAKKVELLEQLRKTLGLSLSQCLAVGDGANDLPMLNKAGLGVAFHGKPLVRQQAPHQINNFDLDTLLHLA
ncbi:phosphoserine phosphatase SerB [Candidatus Njordibacter sp. Uisw_039]|jgi:phosphoserine phosphatase|uniref:phosphoserine phosphatase SerB n=1 Tax=Candidatus Njordibacter sp. Uisw_039 TaxID=3230972 RepID=UPI003A209E00|tara:strand:+ start:4329 stop:5201 length:873 start_codon:yes stop_codon:yes gene_type:complete